MKIKKTGKLRNLKLFLPFLSGIRPLLLGHLKTKKVQTLQIYFQETFANTPVALCFVDVRVSPRM